MKNPNTGKTFLDFDDINEILPSQFCLDAERFSRGVYRAKCGALVSISNSRYYEKGNACWYYVYIDRYLNLGVEYMIFTVGLVGLVFIPMQIMSQYKKGCSWKDGRFPKEKRYRIDIQRDKAGHYYFINSSETRTKKLLLDKYFIPYTK